jgi:hypothetical protein
MKYMLLINHGPDHGNELSEAERKEIWGEWAALNSTPGVTGGAWMEAPETATTVRVEDGKTLVTDGPFVETKEALGGYLFYEADDLDAAIALAARIPSASRGGAIEIRPLHKG